MKFNEVIGQENAKERLLQMANEDRIPHAMMLCGASGSGTFALAVAFASFLLGERDSAETPQQRNAEAMLRKLEHPDLHFTFPVIRPEGVSADRKITSSDFIKEWHEMLNAESPYFTIDVWLDRMNAGNKQARIFEAESDELARALSLKSSQGGWKVSIIWLPERMNNECANKLLKLLEEPPSQTLFIMACEEPDLLLETVRSRVQRIDIPKIDTAAIEQALTERRGIDAETAHRVARSSNGDWLKAIGELSASNENKLFLDMFKMLMRLAYKRDVKELKKWSDAVSTYGREKQIRLLTYFSRMVRENFMYNFRNEQLTYMTKDEEDFARNFARFINEANVIAISEEIEKAIRGIRQNASAKIVFFDFAMQMIMMLIAK